MNSMVMTIQVLQIAVYPAQSGDTENVSCFERHWYEVKLADTPDPKFIL